MSKIPFKVSTHLKDVIGRELVTNQFVAIFELVKNSFDAGATKVKLEFDLSKDRLVILDDGKGMSLSDIKNKWLFVAYSAKADGTEDAKDYRDKIRTPYAGSKGIGRFSCDTLGASLNLYSDANVGKAQVSRLTVNWRDFEVDSKDEFHTVLNNLSTISGFPKLVENQPTLDTGTILLIEGLRREWDVDTIRDLRAYLAKLIDPFGTTDQTEVYTNLVGSNRNDKSINGPIGNNISDVLRDKTARILVEISNGKIVSTLHDRGKLIYKISEDNPYQALGNSQISGTIYYLNRSAKQTFSLRMKVSVVSFGNIFLFLNGFRVFPIGEETDDTFGISRRKQQGTSRYLGTRDVLGRVDVIADPRVFREASSRDAGLIEDVRSRELYEAVTEHMIKRLEKYVVGVNWKDKSDQVRDTPEGLEADPAKIRTLSIVSGLAKSKSVQILEYNKSIVELTDEQDQASQKALKDIEIIAEREQDQSLIDQVKATRKRISDLEKSEKEAREEAARLADEQAKSDQRIETLVKQAEYLSASQNIEAEQIQLLLHQVNIYSGHIKSGANRALSTLGASMHELLDADELSRDDFEDLAGTLRHNLREIMDNLSYISLENSRLQSVSHFAPNIRVNLETSEIRGDLVIFLREYFEVMLVDPSKPKATFEAKNISFECEFSPFDLAVIFDNLIDNARKARAKNIKFTAVTRNTEKTSNLEIRVVDDGLGIDVERVEPSRIFDKHYKGHPEGSGLGLYHVRQVLETKGNSIRLDPKADESRADFLITISKKAES